MAIGDRKRAAISWFKADGSPGVVQGPPEWTNSNPAAYDMVKDPSGTFAIFTKLADQDTHITVTGDADMGAGVRSITAEGDIMADESTRGDLVFTDEP